MDELKARLEEQQKITASTIKEIRGLVENAMDRMQKDSDEMRREIDRLKDEGGGLVHTLKGKFAKAEAEAE